MKRGTRSGLTGGVGKRIVAGIAAAWALVLAEIAIVALISTRLASVWELQNGAAALMPAWLLLAIVPGAVGGASLWCFEHGEETLPRRVLVATGAIFGAACAWGVGGGRHLSSLETRIAFSLGIAAMVGLAVYFKAPFVRAALDSVRRSPGRRAVGATVALMGIVLLEGVNELVLVRLYPAFHAGLSFLGLACAVFVVAPFLAPASSREEAPGHRSPSRRSTLAAPVALVSIAVLAALFLKPAARYVAGFDNFRLLVLDRSTTLGWGVEWAARLAPPPEIRCVDDSELCIGQEPPHATRSQPPGTPLDWRRRDIVLITVDALRADHLGAYGYDRGTSPHLDALSREGTTFERAYAPTPHTSYSVTSLMTGKYMRPLLLRDTGEDSDTWAGLLRIYGYRTAAFYPPAVFFIDTERFSRFENNHLDFEYAKVEFAEGDLRLSQVNRYFESQDQSRRTFLWVHLFGPHEPYEAQPGHDFGGRDIDRYDSEIAAADETIGRLVKVVRARNPQAVVMVTADHGEEFGDHGGRYHGTTVYEEQVRVPMIISAPGSVAVQRVAEPVQTIDLLPTVLDALQVPVPARVRGRNLGPLLGGKQPQTGEGFALAETDEQTLLAEGPYRLVCQRRVGACSLYHLPTDPSQKKDVSGDHPELFRKLRRRAQAAAASHGEFEARGLRQEGKGWPAPILRGLAGDGDAAPELAQLLDDASVDIRRKSAEVLFELARPETAAALRLSMTREEDREARHWAALALTRLGEGAPLVYEMVEKGPLPMRRLAALALAEAGDDRGESLLIAWWQDDQARDHARSRQILEALGRVRAKDAVWPLSRSLDDVRLRPAIATTLAEIGDKDARGYLVQALRKERYQSARVALVDAIVRLGGKEELAVPLVRFLGVPDPLEGGLNYALQAGIQKHVGAPSDRQLQRLRQLGDSGVRIDLVVPRGGNGSGTRLLVLGRRLGDEPGFVHLQTLPPVYRKSSKDDGVYVRNLPEIDTRKALRVKLDGETLHEVAIPVPDEWGVKPGRGVTLGVFADSNVEVIAVAIVPLSDELPPPAPEEWHPEEARSESPDPGGR